jgi:hypothetical protein
MLTTRSATVATSGLLDAASIPGRRRIQRSPQLHPTRVKLPESLVKLLLIIAAAVLAALGPGQGVVAAAELQRETRAATGFSRIEIEGEADVRLRQGSSERVTIEASAQALRQIQTEVSGRTLTVSLYDQRHWWDWILGGGRTRSPRVTIDFIQLDGIEAAGAVRFTGDSLKSDDLRLDFAGACSFRIGDLQAARLRLDGAGATKAELAGKVTSQYVDLSGAGSYQAAELMSDNVVLHLSGAGKAVVNAASTLKVEISGAGSVQYTGNPKVEKNVSGLASVTRREEP